MTPQTRANLTAAALTLFVLGFFAAFYLAPDARVTRTVTTLAAAIGLVAYVTHRRTQPPR